MSMQISVDPAGLTQEQREAVAGFILAYPSSAGTCSHAVAEIPAFIHKDTADAGLVEVGRTIAPAVNELEVLQHDHESTLPVAAFGQPVVDEAAAAFGVPATPLGVSVPLALSTPAIAGASTVAPPSPANTAPITTTPGVASSVAPASSVASNSGVDLDANGLPWDGRIHAESKAKIADGTWRKKRNLDPAILATVEAELRAVMGAAPATPFVPPVAVVAPPPPADVKPSTVTPVLVPSVTPTGEVPQDARAQFVGLVGRASAAIQAGKVTQAEITQCCAAAGVPALPLLANRLDLVAQVAAQVDAMIAAR